jgi:hypothetical protein
MSLRIRGKWVAWIGGGHGAETGCGDLPAQREFTTGEFHTARGFERQWAVQISNTKQR